MLPPAGRKAKLDKDPKDESAARQRERTRDREEVRKGTSVDMDTVRLAEDEAQIEAQRPGVMKDVSLWQGRTDGFAMRGKLHYNSAALRNALAAKDKSDRTRPLPKLLLAVKDAYGFR